MTTQLITNPVIYNPSYEHIEENEQETVQELVETLQSISDVTSKVYGHAVRSVHAKSHGILKGKLIVKDNMPNILKQGIFANPNTYSVVMRLSTSPGDIMADSVSTPRGLAIKVMGVEGERLSGNSEDKTQDFVLVNGPAFLKPDAKSFVSSLKLLAKTTDKAEGFKKVLSASLRGTEKVIEILGGESPTIKSLGGHPETHILGETFFTQVPILYGEYMAKVAVAPISPALIALEDTPLNLNDEHDGLREAVSTFFQSNSGQWELKVQLCTNLDTMPIEDASVVWPEEESPYITVATIEADVQTSWDNAVSPSIEDNLAFSPWNGIQAHRPLGSVMRARRQTYESSSAFRKQFNGCPVHG